MRKFIMPRGKSQKTLDLEDAIMEIAEERQPVTVRGICYPLMEIYGMIPSMEKKHTNRVGACVRQLREEELLPWAWIVDETRKGRYYRHGFDDPAEYLQNKLTNAYRRDYWAMQPYKVELWSEKSTVGGVLDPVLENWSVNFRNMRGYTSATNAHDLAETSLYSDKPTIALYVGDWDPSGLHMSEADLPRRIEGYGGEIDIQRVALLESDTGGSRGLPLEDKQKDPRYNWYVRKCQTDRFWELDGMDPRLLRDRVGQAIERLVDREAWDRCMVTERAEYESLDHIFKSMREQASALFRLG
jgi:hypothetical protein